MQNRFFEKKVTTLLLSNACQWSWTLSSVRTMPVIVFTAIFCLLLSYARAQETDEWTAPASEATRKNPIRADDRSIRDGKRIYLKRCAACHGKNGNGDGPDAIDLGLHPAKFSGQMLHEESDGALYWKITTGKKPMPDYGSRLSGKERWDVINFLRTLAGKGS